MSFSDDIAKFVKKCGTNTDLVVRKTVLNIGTKLVERTPVGDTEYWTSLQPSSNIATHKVEYKRKPPPGYVGGHARANWTYSEGVRVEKEIKGIDKTGTSTIANIMSGVPQKAAGLVHYIQNSVPYIQALEDGHSRQAPNGMVALTQIEFKDYVNKALSEIK